ncbi:efflux transporter outer membrane subunit [Pseudomonas chlororaphis]|uniref:efflux transporter outer membrane subunit n=1 Tax=Pseudomonas chlororaphis TaxID=587753 RepID=UPI0009BA0DB9|nr:efflux transporter outer membrane subunit [Pseudomonas chlororaphis]
MDTKLCQVAIHLRASKPKRTQRHQVKHIARLRYAVLGLVVPLVLVGCAVGPDYVKPDIALESFHSRIEKTSTDAANKPAPLDRWWEGFNDPQLTAIIQRALAQNLELAAALARVDQARAAAQAAGAQLLPTLDANASVTALRQSLQSPLGTLARGFPDYDRNQREYVVGGAATWEIDLAGGLRRNAAAARAEAQAADAAQIGTRISVAADAADAYVQIRGYQSRIAVTQDQIDTDNRLLELVGLRRKLGAADDREIAQAEAVLRQAKSTIPLLQIGLEAQFNRLDVLLGVQPGTYAQILGQDGDIPTIPGVADNTSPVDVLRRRPDVIAAERLLAASNERIGVSISDYYPKISLSGMLGFDSISTNGLFRNRSFQPMGTAGLRWRIFDFGKVDAEVKQARGSYAEALALYRQTVLKATEDVENALTVLNQSQIRRQELAAEVDALNRSRDLSEKAYKAGAITLTDVLHADRLLLVARDNLDSVRADSVRAAVGVFRALGGGWDVPEAKATSKSDEIPLAAR